MASAASAGAAAAEHRFSLLLDTDNNAATGCSVATANGTASGIERVATTVVSTTVSAVTVARLERQVCAGGVLGAPAVYDAGGWNVGLGNGTGGTAVIEASIPLADLPPGATMKALVAATNATGGQDATSSFLITLPAPAALGAIAVPLSPWLMLPLSLLLLVVALAWCRRHPERIVPVVLLLFVSGTGLVWAATVIRDGNVSDWGGVSAAVSDGAGDGPVNADISAVFHQQDGSNLYLRIDADVRKDVAGNQAPVVGAGPNQTITLPAAANLSGSASDDGLPNPPGALTTTWSTVSGPGAVVFGNANALATTATFSVAGTYVLRLTASDGALSTSGTLQVNVNDVNNAGPQLAAIADRTVVLGTRFQQVLEGSSPNVNETLTYALPTAPTGAALQPAPLVDWMPTLAQLGTQNFTAKVTDSQNRTATTSFKVTVIQVNHPPQLAPQADASVKIGTAFARTLGASDPDAGDTLTFALVTGPAGMVLTGAELSWPTAGKAVGDYAVTVKVTDAGGLSDTRSFTIKLLPVVAPSAKDDKYEVRLGQTLNINATLGVLANDLAPDGQPLTAAKLTDPDKGSLATFNADGSFSYVAPPTLPGPVFAPVVKYSVDAFPYGWAHQPVVIDVDGDGVPEIITNSLTPGGNGLTAYHVKNGALVLLWDLQDVSLLAQTADCTTYYAGGEPMRLAAGDIDDSGQIAIVIPVACKRDIPTVPSWTAARYVAVNARDGTFKWLSPSLGGTRPEPLWGGTSEDSIAYGTVPAIARMRAGESPSIVFAQEYANDQWGTQTRCERITPGFVGTWCRAAFVLDGRDGTVRQTMTALATDSAFPPTQGTNSTKPAAVVADLDGTGNMNIIFGATVWNADGSIKWNITDSPATDPNSHLYTFWNGLGNFDDTPDVEIVRLDRTAHDSGGGPARLAVFKPDGRMLWSALLSGDPWHGIPTIADVDGSGRPAVVVIDSLRVCAIDFRGLYKWCHDGGQSTLANTPNLRVGTRVAVYDLDGDGVPEVVVPVYGERLRFLDGATGKVKFEFDMAAGRPPIENGPYFRDPTLVGSPLVADFENNGHASILTVWAPSPRMDIVASQRDDWRPARKIFNQTSYHVGNVNDNGSIPQAFVNNFANPATNVFGTQAQVLTPVDPRVRSQTSYTYAASAGGVASDPAKVTIEILPSNRPPAFTSTPPTRWTGSFPSFDYYAHAVDPDVGDTVAYSMVLAGGSDFSNGAANCTIGASSGVLHCPTLYSGDYTFIIAATDSFGDVALQTVALARSIGPATVPNVVGQSRATADTTLAGAGFVAGTVNAIYFAAPANQVLAQFPAAGTTALQGEAVALQVSKGPQPQPVPNLVGLTLTQAQVLLGGLGLTVIVNPVNSPTAQANEIIGQLPVFGTTLTPPDPVTLDVSIGPPLVGTVAQVIVEPAPSALRVVGEKVAYRATAVFTDGTSTDVTIASLWNSSVPAVASMDTTGGAKALTAGATTISAKAGGVTGQATLNVVARTPGDVITPVALITSPADGATVTGPTTVTGTASDANFLRYELAMALAGDTTWTVIGEGNTAVATGTLGTFDPTTLVNDLYALRLTVFDRNGNQTVATTTLQATGNRKIGLFTLAFQDLSVALAGVPITVTRTYDSRDKTKGDFGIGWRLAMQSIRLRSNRVPGTGWVRTVAGPTVTLAPTSEHKTSVTLPDGRVEEFDLVLSPTANVGSLDATTAAGYAARPGTQGKLEALGNSGLLILGGGAEDELVDDLTLDTYQPKRYRYTTLNGTQIEIDRIDGVRKITDANGNSVSFGPGGVTHSSGSSVAFTRDAQGRITSVTDPKGSVQTYAYDANGDLIAHTDPEGGLSRYAYDRNHALIDIHSALGTRVSRNDYDAAGRLVAVTDAAGKQITFTHNAAANEDIVTDRLGRPTRMVYDAAGNVVLLERAVSIEGTSVTTATTATYDALGNNTTRIDPDGLRTASTFSGVNPLTRAIDPSGLNLATAFAYSARGDVTHATDPGGRAFDFTYDVVGNLTGFATPLAGAGTATADAQGLPLQTRDALGNSTVMARDSLGRVTREEAFDAGAVLLRRVDYTYDPNGNRTSATLYRTINGSLTPLTTQFAYDASDRLVAVTDPLGGISRTEYDADGKVIAAIDPTGRRTTYTYDVLGRLVQTTYPDATSEATSYDAEGNAVTLTDRAGRTTTQGFDEFRRNTTITRSDGSSTRTVYTAGGRVAATIDAKGNRTDYTYDTAGRRTSIALPAVIDGPGGPLIRPQVASVLNALGAPVSATDAKGRTTSYQYDAGGRLVQTTFSDGSTVQQTFDVLGRRTSVTNEEGQTTTVGYDGLGRLVAVSGLAGNATYAYDEAGNLVSQTDALGRITRFQYDALNRMTRRQYPGGETELIAYDVAGNPVARTDGLGRVTSVTYDSMNRPTAKTLPGGTKVAYAYQPDGQPASVVDHRGVTTYNYDGLGQLASIAHPTGETVSYARDVNGNLASLASPAGTVNYSYDALNRLTQVNAPEGQSLAYYDLVGNRVRQKAANGVVTDATFDLRNRVVQRSDKAGGVTLLQSFASSYSAAGRRTGITESDGSAESYTYDAKGRLTSETRAGTNAFAITHAYDAVGNRVQSVSGGTPTSYSYDSNDRILTDGTNAYAWDANGNLISKTQGTNVTLYGYDAESRLVSIVGAGMASQYVYDDAGNRVQAVTAGGTTRFLVDAANNSRLAQVLEERDGGGALQARYSYGTELLAMTRGATSSFQLHDGLGSTRALADAGGALTDRYQYDAYGNAISAVGTTVNPYRYRGERLDADSNLYQLRARYYSPAQGRFTTRDPAGGSLQSPVSRHRYLYANADPVNNSDPTGRETLVELSFTQGLQSLIASPRLYSAARTVCGVNTTVEQVDTLVGLTGAAFAAAGLAYAFTSAANEANPTGGKGGASELGYTSPVFGTAPGIKQVSLHYKATGGQAGLVFGITRHNDLGFEGTVLFRPPPVKTSGMFKSTLETTIRDFKYCGTASLGKLVFKVEGSIGAVYEGEKDPGEPARGLYGAGSMTAGLEAQFFRGTFKFSWPILEYKVEGLQPSLVLFGLYQPPP